ncbi:MAG TPA: histidine phosphatase family protein [Candidatus Binatia bacterium]|jgi:broad specificity phosphatase PhoE|nr:histidine phosphatase family protein [Candidatus Binatia bacterium]
MKWPSSLTLIRHDTSAYNVLRDAKKKDGVYAKFLAAWEKDPDADETCVLAREVVKKFALGVGDSDTPLADAEGRQARTTGEKMAAEFETPEVIYVSPYTRTLETLRHLIEGWPALEDVRIFKDERIREQEHGLALLYNDWRVFECLHPEQRGLRKMEGAYWYRFPQGENVPDVRLRNRSWIETLIRDWRGKRVLAVTHHLNILATRATLERLDAEEFLRLDKEEKPINCGVTMYKGHPDKGADGRLLLEFYNRKYY